MGDTTMTEYTPTSEHIKTEWVESGGISDTNRLHATAQFDRWLAAHDAEVAANALREAATGYGTPGMTATTSYVRGWLREEADRIEREVTHHNPNGGIGEGSDA